MKKFFVFFLLFYTFLVWGNMLVLFHDSGIYISTVSNGYEIPENWEPLTVDAQRWFIETKEYNMKFVLATVDDLSGIVTVDDGYYVDSDGNKYAFIDGNLFGKVYRQESSKRYLLFDSKIATATFKVPSLFEIYYVLKNDELFQFFRVKSDVDEAFVVAVLSPAGGYIKQRSYAMMSEGINSLGKKIYILGELDGLKNGMNILRKTLKIEREDYNFVYLNFKSSTNSWIPAQRIIRLKTPEQLPRGRIVVWSPVNGYTLPLDEVYLPDVESETEINLGSSWEGWYKWQLEKLLKYSQRTMVKGTLFIKGKGKFLIKISGNNIKDLKTNANILSVAGDYALLQVNLKGYAKINLEFSVEHYY
ncbi:hypothetical protein JYK00_05705 [Thermosipho ferrireducens]|uniref:Uncharacterized protein n=1 Tax=Thermosipho ferrireducens TaxID=2571116 RepID=A0ABX7S488_9BACT|nr:hypothetical protein [Thermosipho ferrireducens]QTA37239.1 hypothetical protein JYK00_05705 [Thermosipho ferrireducens]